MRASCFSLGFACLAAVGAALPMQDRSKLAHLDGLDARGLVGAALEAIERGDGRALGALFPLQRASAPEFAGAGRADAMIAGLERASGGHLVAALRLFPLGERMELDAPGEVTWFRIVGDDAPVSVGSRPSRRLAVHYDFRPDRRTVRAEVAFIGDGDRWGLLEIDVHEKTDKDQ